MAAWIGASGIEFDAGGDPAMYAISYGNCRSLKGHLVRTQADLQTYLSRIYDEVPGFAEDPDFETVYTYFTQKVPAEDAEKVSTGLSLCVPLSCDRPELVRRILLAYWACLASDTCQGLEHVPLPDFGIDLNVTFVADTSLEPRPEQGLPCGSSCRVPWWLGCAGELHARESEWRNWSGLVRDWRASPSNESLRLAAILEADRLAEYHWQGALQWTSWVVTYTGQTCGLEHHHFEPSPAEDQPPRPLHWEAIDSWKHERGFCPHGYAAALTLRAVTRREANLGASAAQDLKMLRAVLGGCADLEEDMYRACARSFAPAFDRDERGGAEEPGEAENLAVAEAAGCGDPLLHYSRRLLQGLLAVA